MTKPPFGGQSEVIQLPRKSGAGEGARTLDPDLGKVRGVSKRLGLASLGLSMECNGGSDFDKPKLSFLAI